MSELFDNEIFSSNDCSITYPIMRAFTEWLISSYRMDQYLQFYKYENATTALKLVYNQTIKELNKAFVDYVQLFETDEVLEQRMKKLANS